MVRWGHRKHHTASRPAGWTPLQTPCSDCGGGLHLGRTRPAGFRATELRAWLLLREEQAASAGGALAQDLHKVVAGVAWGEEGWGG